MIKVAATVLPAIPVTKRSIEQHPHAIHIPSGIKAKVKKNSAKGRAIAADRRLLDKSWTKMPNHSRTLRNAEGQHTSITHPITVPIPAAMNKPPAARPTWLVQCCSVDEGRSIGADSVMATKLLKAGYSASK